MDAEFHQSTNQLAKKPTLTATTTAIIETVTQEETIPKHGTSN